MSSNSVTRPYYKFDAVRSYNAPWMFIAGGRGIGKTFGCKENAVRDFIRKGDMFIYLRRYKDELKTSKNTFFADFEYKFPKHDFRVMGSEAQIAPIKTRGEKGREWQTMGYFISLSTAQGVKSVAFPRVKTIIFDEFIIEKGNIHYLPDEATVFLNFFNTVDRAMDKTRVFFLANAVSIMNPYFIKYNIMPEKGDEFIKRSFNGDLFIVAHFPDSQAFADVVNETRFGKFIRGTEYAEYAVQNQFADNHDNLLSVKDYRARYQFSLEAHNGTFSIWLDSVANEWFVQKKRPKDEKMFTLLPERMSKDKTYIQFNDKMLGFLRTAFRHGRVTFDHPSTRNTFTEIFKR